MIHRLAIFLTGCCLIPATMARTCYLHPDGDDTRPGTTRATAWRTLARASQERWHPGDTLLLESEAVFTGTLHIRMAPATGDQARFYIGPTGAAPAVIQAETGHGIWLDNCSGLDIHHLTVRGSGVPTHDGNGVLLLADRPVLDGGTGITLRDLDVSGFRRGGITGYVSLQTQAPVYRDLLIQRVTTHHNGDHGLSLSGIYSLAPEMAAVYPYEQVRILHVLAYENQGQPDKKNTHTGSGIVVGNARHVVIAHCEAHHNGSLNTHAGGGPVGIWLWDVADGVIEYCQSHHNRTGSQADGGGFDLDGGCVRCVMQYNRSWQNDGAGYLIAAFAYARPTHDLVIRFNLSEDDGRQNSYGALHLWRDSQAALSDIWMYNNTIRITPVPGARPAAYRNISPGIPGIRVYNNVLCVTGPLRVVDHLYPSQALFTHNLYLHPGTHHAYAEAGQLVAHLNDWRSQYHRERYDGLPTGWEDLPPAATLPPASWCPDKIRFQGMDIPHPAWCPVPAHDLAGHPLPADQWLVGAYGQL
jgi:hypothetical protein